MESASRATNFIETKRSTTKYVVDFAKRNTQKMEKMFCEKTQFWFDRKLFHATLITSNSFQKHLKPYAVLSWWKINFDATVIFSRLLLLLHYIILYVPHVRCAILYLLFPCAREAHILLQHWEYFKTSSLWKTIVHTCMWNMLLYEYVHT